MPGYVGSFFSGTHKCPWVQTCVSVSVYSLPMCALISPYSMPPPPQIRPLAHCFLLILPLSLSFSSLTAALLAQDPSPVPPFPAYFSHLRVEATGG